MNGDVRSLLAWCSELGVELAPGADGKLKVKAPAPLPADLREELKKRKAEILSFLQGYEEKDGHASLSAASSAVRVWVQ